MKRYIKASKSDAIITSRGGNFSLVETDGVGVNNTPWSGYEVERSELAEQYVVEVRIRTKNVNFEGAAVQLTPIACYVGYGMRMRQSTLSDLKQFIALLEEAMDFKVQIDKYFEDVEGYQGGN